MVWGLIPTVHMCLELLPYPLSGMLLELVRREGSGAGGDWSHHRRAGAAAGPTGSPGAGEGWWLPSVPSPITGSRSESCVTSVAKTHCASVC